LFVQARLLFAGHMMPKRSFILVVIAGLAVTVYLYVSDRQGWARLDAERARDLSDLRSQVASLTGTVQILDRPTQIGRPIVLNPSLPQAAATASVAAVAAVSAVSAAPPAPVPPAVREQEALDHLEAAFTSEDPDPVWSRAQTSILGNELASVLPKTSAISSTECKRSICRVETTHSDLDTYRNFVHAAFISPNLPVDMGPMMTTLLNAGNSKVVSVSYVARQGYALPTLEQ
jgi:hypothetical protein